MYNSTIIINERGEICGNHRKYYLWGEEKLCFKKGNSFSVYDTSIGRVGILTCYDAEFPVPSRILALKGAEIIFVPSVWSFTAEPRWDIQLPARALDNCYL